MIIGQTPEDWTIYPPSGDNLTVAWRIRNIGAQNWDSNNVQIDFTGGTRMMPIGVRPTLTEAIASGQEGALLITFTLPTRRERYVTRWALTHGGQSFCDFAFQVNIK